MRDRDSCTMPGKLLPPSKRLSQVTEKRERQSHTLQMVKVYLQQHRPVLNVCKCKMRSDKYAFLIKGMYLSLTVINGPICGGDNGIFQHYVFVEAVKLKDCQPAACMRRLSLYISVYVEYVQFTWRFGDHRCVHVFVCSGVTALNSSPSPRRCHSHFTGCHEATRRV